jgi:beta-lactamase class A
MQALGLAHVRLRRKMMDGAAAARGDENVSTPRDLARLLRVLLAGEGLTPAGHAAAITVLEVGAEGQIRRGVPDGIAVLNEPGDLEGVGVDAAIVRVKDRPFTLWVMTTYLKNDEDGERAITDVSRVFADYFGRLGAGSEYGRQIRR